MTEMVSFGEGQELVQLVCPHRTSVAVNLERFVPSVVPGGR